ncbi:MAG: VCBS repeat-containing protein, partial [Planctomycetota bacterium]
ADGYPDVIVGAPQGDFIYGNYGPGYAQVFSGKDASVLYTWTSSGAADFGVAVSGAGDVDADGHADLLGGDWFESSGGGIGGAYVYSGSDGSVLSHTSGGYNWGSALASAGDVNRDGHADFLISAYPVDQVVLFSGAPCPASWSNYGSGWPGTHGVPAFTCSANPALCDQITIDLDNSSGVITSGTLLVGFSPASVPTALGGTLNVVPAFVLPLTIPANGIQAPVGIPCDPALCGAACYLQAMEVDPGASLGVSFTRGLQMTLGG